MAIQDAIEAIDREISKLQQVKELLGEGQEPAPAGKRRGRPIGSTNKTQAREESAPTRAKRVMSAEGKARIADAQKKRWADKRSPPIPQKKTDKKVSPPSSGMALKKLPVKKVAAKKVAAARKTAAFPTLAETSTPEAGETTA